LQFPKLKLSHGQPVETAKKSLSEVDPIKYATGNFQGEVTSAVQVSNMKKENRLEARREMGIIELDFNSVSDIRRVNDRIEHDDLATRAQLGDPSTDLLGVLRSDLVILPEIKIELASKPALVYAGELSEQGNLFGAIDASGQMYRLKGEKKDGKQIQHIIFATQPRESFLCMLEHALSTNRDFNSFVIGEFVTSTTVTQAVASWMGNMNGQVQVATLSALGRKLSIRIKLLRIDNAGQLATGVIVGLRVNGMVDSQKTYCNVAFIILFRFDGMIKDEKDMSIDDIVSSGK